MKKPVKTLLLGLLCLLALAGTAIAESSDLGFPPAAEDLSGEWRVFLENSNSRKTIRFSVEEKDGRLRGKLKSKEMGTQDLDGRREEEGKVLFWSTWYEKGGGSVESNFKGRLEGETVVGECRFFEKPYSFRAERVVPKSKTR